MPQTIPPPIIFCIVSFLRQVYFTEKGQWEGALFHHSAALGITCLPGTGDGAGLVNRHPFAIA